MSDRQDHQDRQENPELEEKMVSQDLKGHVVNQDIQECKALR